MSRRPPAATRPPVPVPTRRLLIGGAVLLVVAAAVVNISHTRTNAARLGQDPLAVLVIGLLPDITLPMSVMRLRHYRRCLWGWTGVGLSVALIAWSALALAEHGLPGQLMSLTCLAFAIVAAGQAHLPAAESPTVLIAHIEALAEDAVRAADAFAASAEEAARTLAEDAQETVRQTRADASAAVAEASAEAVRTGVRIAELEASADGLRTQLADAQRAVREASAPASAPASGKASGKVARTRPATVRKAPGTPSARTPSGTSDVQQWRTARDGYKASVRAGERWPNERLACALHGCTDACADGTHRPEPDVLTTARKRGYDWRCEVEGETSGRAAGGES